MGGQPTNVWVCSSPSSDVITFLATANGSTRKEGRYHCCISIVMSCQRHGANIETLSSLIC